MGLPVCPSAPATAEGGVVFGVVRGDIKTRRVAYLTETVRVTTDILAATAPASANEVLRTAAPCAETGCQHFDGRNCALVQRMVTLLPVVVGSLPQCGIRPHCRWWQQEGPNACVRCPQVVTASPSGSEQWVRFATPPRGA